MKLTAACRGHAEIVGVIVGVEEFIAIVYVVDVAPAAAIVGFEEGGKADVVEDTVPVEGKLKVAQRALVGVWRGVFCAGGARSSVRLRLIFLRERS